MEYTITKVSSQKPKEFYSEQYKSTTYYIMVMLEGHDRPVTIGKKRADAFKVGDKVYGRIIPTQYDTDKFQAEQPAGKPGQTFTPKDQDAIKAQMAVKSAMNAMPNLDLAATDGDIATYANTARKLAKHIFRMVDEVKESAPPITQESVDKEFKQDKAKEDKVHPMDDDEPINLDDIPF